MAIILWDESHPGIKIVEHQTRTTFFQEASDALNKIRSEKVGKGLLKTIAAKCLFSGKSVFIAYHVASLAGISGMPTEAYGYVAQDAEKKVYFVPGLGQSASVTWDPEDPGPPYAQRPSFVGLAHELIHAFIIVHGMQVADTNTADGLAINECQVVGLGRFAGEPFTENAIRAEHGIELRTKYEKDHQDFATKDFITGVKPLPFFASSLDRP
jgi:hypothetical protein